MSEKSYIDIQFKGKHLFPNVLAKKINLPIVTLVSSGEFGKVGRYKGKPSPYGIGLLKIDPTSESIDQHSDILIKNKSKLKRYNVEEIIFDVDSNSEELEKLSISGSLLKKLSSLNARIQFYNHDTSSNDLSVLFDKIIKKNYTLSHPQKQELHNFLHVTASYFETTHLKPEYVYALVISYLESSKSKKRISKKILEKAAKEFEEI